METGDIYYWVGSGRWQGNKQKENECEMEDNESEACLRRPRYIQQVQQSLGRWMHEAEASRGV